jgi:long-chain acyl-CoA synthetase
MNQHFGKVEQIKKIALLSEPWGIETGELSPTLKLKRRVLYQKYEETIEALYEEA